jgi:hypothetical protein
MQNAYMTPWSKSDDDQFRLLAENGTPPDIIACMLQKNVAQLRRRAYDLGLPLKWFKSRLSEAPCEMLSSDRPSELRSLETPSAIPSRA